ncbi:MAG TPA: hypothetical protein VJQ50_09630 [Terriglobales bacterium]|jgi:hypothetical protein|nr:hypothetical protein [Terriglobales bacterium]
MSAIFKKHNVRYALEKIGDFLRGTGSGVLAGWPETSAKMIVEALRELECEMRVAGMTPETGIVPLAIYAAQELQRHLKAESSDIRNRNAALVYFRCLGSLIRELRLIDQHLEQRASRA